MPTKTFNTTAKPILRDIEADDTRAALRIWDREFGLEADDAAVEWIEDATDTDRQDVWGVVAEDLAADELVGFGLAAIGSREWTDGYFRGLIERDLPNDCAVMHVGCVASNYQGRGLGKRIFKARFKWARRQGANAVLGVSWVREGRYGSSTLFEHFDFDRLKTVPNYYSEHFDEPSSCPDCGTPCECGATFYAWGLGSRGDAGAD